METVIKIEKTGQVQKAAEISVDTSKKQLDVVDILKNSTRFMIHGLLSIYPELSLKQLKGMTGKSKPTLSEHLTIMIHSGLVEVSREEDWRGSMKKKWFALTPEADEETEMVGRKSSKKSPEENLTDRIQTFISFAETKRNLLENWAEYLDHLKEEIQRGKFEEVHTIMEEMKCTHEIFTSSSYYNRKHARLFIADVWTTYNKLENARRVEAGLPVNKMEEEKKEDDTKPPEQKLSPANANTGKLQEERPYFASVDLIPIKRVFDFKAEKYRMTQKAKKK